jgi:hypothetical protein
MDKDAKSYLSDALSSSPHQARSRRGCRTTLPALILTATIALPTSDAAATRFLDQKAAKVRAEVEGLVGARSAAEGATDIVAKFKGTCLDHTIHAFDKIACAIRSKDLRSKNDWLKGF